MKTLEDIRQFLNRHPGTSFALRRQRDMYSVRIAAPGDSKQVVTMMNESLEAAVQGAADSYDRLVVS